MNFGIREILAQRRENEDKARDNIFRRDTWMAQKKRGGFEPIPASQRPCRDLEHSPPSMLYIPPGMQYRHICPSCGRECVLRGSEVTL